MILFGMGPEIVLSNNDNIYESFLEINGSNFQSYSKIKERFADVIENKFSDDNILL